MKKKKHAMGPADKAPMMAKMSESPGKGVMEKMPGKLPEKPKPLKPTGVENVNKDREIARLRAPKPAKVPNVSGKPLPPKEPPMDKPKPAMGLSGAGAVHGLRAHAHGVSHCVAPVSSGVLGAARSK